MKCVSVCFFGVCLCTGHVKLNLQRELSCDGRVSEQLIGFFQSGVFSRDSIYGQNPVTDLQDTTSAHTDTTNTHTQMAEVVFSGYV